MTNTFQYTSCTHQHTVLLRGQPPGGEIVWSVRHTGSFRRCRTNLASSMKSDEHWSQNWLQPICFQPIADMKRNQTRMHKIFTVSHALSFRHPDFFGLLAAPRISQTSMGWNQKGGSSPVSTPEAGRFNCKPP